MDHIIRNAITKILQERIEFLKIAIRQKSKFEGWLKFELAHYLEKMGMESVEVESKMDRRRDRYDISFFHNGEYYRVELKTPNTNWNIPGVKKSRRPITDNIKSIVNDAKKLNSNQGIVAFVLFPIPVRDHRWKAYIDRISAECEIPIDKDRQCTVIELKIDNENCCELIVCSFKSKMYTNWY